jgi:hypothetical protein
MKSMGLVMFMVCKKEEILYLIPFGPMGQFGFVGLAVYCWIFFLLLKQLYLTFSSFSFGYGKAFVLGSFVLFVQSIVVSIADPVFLRPPQNIFIFACLGISYAVRRNTQENEYTYSK